MALVSLKTFLQFNIKSLSQRKPELITVVSAVDRDFAIGFNNVEKIPSS